MDINFSTIVSVLQNVVQAVNALNSTLKSTFAQFSTVTTTATTGTNGAPPAQVVGYLTVTVNGTAYKVPLYNP